MDRMKAPQEWNAVKGAMNGVLREIGDDNRQRQLDEKRQASDGVDQPRKEGSIFDRIPGPSPS